MINQIIFNILVPITGIISIAAIIIIPIKVIKRIKRNQYLKERQIQLLEEQNELLRNQQKEV